MIVVVSFGNDVLMVISVRLIIVLGMLQVCVIFVVFLIKRVVLRGRLIRLVIKKVMILVYDKFGFVFLMLFLLLQVVVLCLWVERVVWVSIVVSVVNNNRFDYYIRMLVNVKLMNKQVVSSIWIQLLWVLCLLVCIVVMIVGIFRISRILVVFDLIMLLSVSFGILLRIVCIDINSLGVEVLKVIMVNDMINVGILRCSDVFIVFCINVFFVLSNRSRLMFVKS